MIVIIIAYVLFKLPRLLLRMVYTHVKEKVPKFSSQILVIIVDKFKLSPVWCGFITVKV